MDPTIDREPRGYSLDELLAIPIEDLERLQRDRLTATQSALLADYLERLHVNQRRKVLRLISLPDASDVLAEMDVEESAEVVEAMQEERALKVLEHFDPDDAADVVGELDEKHRNRLLGKLDNETAQEIRTLLTYAPETAGGIMTPDVATIGTGLRVDEAIQRIRQMSEELEHLIYVYVVDSQERLLGTVSMRNLILAQADQKIEDIMTTEIVGVLHPGMDREAVALIMSDVNYHALPVLDDDGRVLGIVTDDDIIDVLQEEATEDMQKLVGAGGDESIHDDIRYSLSHRTPWLFFNLITASLAALVVSFFEGEIQQLTLLAVFMPIIAGIGGNTGQQTLAVAIRSLALNEIHEGESRKLSFKEAFKGLLSGLIIGLIAAAAAWAFTQRADMAGVVFLAMILNMTLAGLAGAFIPLMLRRMNLDPAQSSSIFLTAITDISGFFIFLSLGAWLLL